MDLALTQSFIVTQGDENSIHFPNYSQTDIRDSDGLKSKTQNFDEQENQLGSHSRSQSGSNNTTINLFKTKKSDEDGDNTVNIYDGCKYDEQVKFLLQDLNQSLNIKLNGFIFENKKMNQITVYVYLVFLKIGEIDTIKERFQADAYIESYWNDSTVDYKAPFDPRKHWNPDLQIENSIGELKQEIRYKTKKVNGLCRIHEIRNVKGVFWERLELWDFPLDVQELSITLSTRRSEDEVIFEQNPECSSAVNTQDFLNQQEWNIFTHVSTSKKSVNDLWSKCKRPCLSTTALVSRKPGYFIYNAYMLIFFVSTLGFVPFSFSVSNNQFRIQVTSLLILTSVNFRWIVTQRLPTVSYLTTLDYYAIGALIFLVGLCAWHACIGSDLFSGIDTQRDKIDTTVLIVIGVIYILYHIIYFTIFFMKYRRYDTIGNKAEYDAFERNSITISNSQSLNSVNSQTPTSEIRSNSIFKRRKSKVNNLTTLVDDKNKPMKNFDFNITMQPIGETPIICDNPKY